MANEIKSEDLAFMTAIKWAALAVMIFCVSIAGCSISDTRERTRAKTERVNTTHEELKNDCRQCHVVTK